MRGVDVYSLAETWLRRGGRSQLANLQSELDKARSRTDSLFALMSAQAMYERPIPERNRLIFYLGHLEAFDWNQICRWTLGMPVVS